MSCMCTTKLWVAAGALDHVSCGDFESPAAVLMGGITAPSPNDLDVRRMAGGAGAAGAPPPARCPPPAGACCAAAAATIDTAKIAADITRAKRIASPLDKFVSGDSMTTLDTLDRFSATFNQQ